MSKEQNFMIDVAKDRIYQNQDKEYYEEFSKWRADENNPYGYQFTHDTRVHSYVDGEGYLLHKADVAERIALYKCLGLLGIVMIVMTAIDFFQAFLISTLSPNTSGNIIYFSNTNANSEVDLYIAVICGIMNLARFIVPALIFKSVSKIPKRVAVPSSETDSRFIGSSVVIMLVIMVLGRIGSCFFSKVMGLIGIDTIYSYVSFSNSPIIIIINVLTYCILVPIAAEYLFRGLILQTFRQFGDLFAIFVTCFVGGFSYYDLSCIGYGVCCSIVLGLFTIRTGTLKTAVFMNISAHSLNYLLSFLSISDITYGRIFEIIICALIVGGSIVVYSRLLNCGDWSFNINTSSGSQIPLGKKVKMIFTTNSIAIWIAAVIIMFFVASRLL